MHLPCISDPALQGFDIVSVGRTKSDDMSIATVWVLYASPLKLTSIK